MHAKLKKIITISVSLLCLIILLFFGVKILGDYYWFKSLGFHKRYLKELFFKIILFSVSFLFFFILSYINNILTKKTILSLPRRISAKELYTKEIKIILFYFIILLSIIFGLSFSNKWLEILRFYNYKVSGLTDPIFLKDVTFYIFRLPLFLFLKKWLIWIFIFNLTFSIIFYFLSNNITITLKSIFIPKKIRLHLGVTLFFIFLLFSYECYLKKYQLLWNNHTIIKGANYVDVNAKILAYNIMTIFNFLIGLTFIYWAFSDKLKSLFYAFGIYLIVLLLFNYISPFLLQKFKVDPNEIEVERKYIEYTIKFTRFAYKIDNVKIKEFTLKDKFKIGELKNYEEIIANIPVWDWRPLKRNFKQLQEIRPYYLFSEIGIDRYYINNHLKQVMVSAREITHSNLPKEAKNWINKYLKYTHGYGIVASYASEIEPEGLPKFIIKDIPPKSSEPELKIIRPEIYFGTTFGTKKNYVIVNTKIPEFDYPKGSENVYSFYKADSGIKIDSFFKRIILSLYLNDFKILLSDFIKNSSRILLYRNIITRVKKIAPFFIYDNNPYIVLAKGKLYWIVDAYTYSKNFPYSEKYNEEINYIRNSVKVIIDAYTGKISFIIIDKSDPIVITYKNIFPDIFKDISTIDSEIVKHFKYPKDIFLIQATMYLTYHMENIDVFYNREDIWEFPNQVYDENEILMTGYYLLNVIDKRIEFLYMLPFTPTKKDNMIGWMYARCEWENYGELVVYTLPKDRLVYGPMQIEARIDQHPEISKLISLWSQKGSRVIRGDLFVIPIKNSIFYFEPLYLQAEKQDIPELKMIICAYNDKITMANNVKDAIIHAIK